MATPNDFGSAGQPPTHPKLLDWLAAELIESGWSIEHPHRSIMSSVAYQRSSAVQSNPSHAIDPDNKNLWRGPFRRLDLKGLDHEQLTFFYAGLDQKLTAVVPAHVIKELVG